MSTESIDIIRRRPPPPPAAAYETSQTTSIRKSVVRSGRRKKNSAGGDRAACIAMITFAAIFIPLGLLMKSFLGRGSTAAGVGTTDSNSNNGGPNPGNFVQNWKPKSLRSGHGNNNVALDTTKTTRKTTVDNPKEARYQSLYQPKFDQSNLGYDIYNCPSGPPDDYPRAWSATEVLTNWNPNDVTTIPPNYREIYHSLCIFDFQTQYDTALAYRNAEKPFIIRNDPNVMNVVKRWDDDLEYLHKELGDEKKTYTERSPKNHFMFYNARKRKQIREWKQPENDVISMTFGEWLERALERDALALGSPETMDRVKAMREKRLALVTDGQEADDDEVQVDNDREREKRMKWYYFRLNGFLEDATVDGSMDKFIFDEATFFDPRKPSASQFYLVNPEVQRGINCRFGMRGIVAENHYDASRNMIALLGGERRYVIAAPSECSKMALYPPNHPSGRHSSFDFSNPSEWDTHPEFKDALMNEVVLHAGDVLYLPTAWFHYITNLGLNYQCNIRSGVSEESADALRKCGFDPPKEK